MPDKLQESQHHHSNIGKLCQHIWATQAGHTAFATVIGVVYEGNHWEYRLHLASTGDVFNMHIERFKDCYEFV